MPCRVKFALYVQLTLLACLSPLLRVGYAQAPIRSFPACIAAMPLCAALAPDPFPLPKRISGEQFALVTILPKLTAFLWA